MYHKGGEGKSKGFGFQSFSLGTKKPESSSSGMEGVVGPSNFMPGRLFGYTTNIGKKRVRNEDEYVLNRQLVDDYRMF